MMGESHVNPGQDTRPPRGARTPPAGWTIDTLFYGQITGPAKMILEGLDEETFTNPYLGFLLRDGTRCVLVDCGISDRFIVDGKAWGGFPAEGGRRHVLAALRKCGVTPADVDTVLYTHLHNDHAGNCDLFPAATHIFQRDEWANLIDPLPAQNARRDYDPEVVAVLGKARCLKIDGDAEVLPGVKLYKAPGHTLGSQLITVDTEQGAMVIIGDLCLTHCHLFPEIDEITDMDGKTHAVRTNVEKHGPAIPFLVYDYYAWYDSVHTAKALAQSKPEFVLPGHEPSLVTKFRR